RHPGNIHPQEKDRDDGESAVDRAVKGRRPDIDRETYFEDLDSHGCNYRPKRPVSPPHGTIRYQAIEETESDEFEEGRHGAGETVKPAAGEPCHCFLPEAGLARGNLEIGRERQADPNQERPEGYQSPIGEEPLHPGTRRANAPDQVELILDG